MPENRMAMIPVGKKGQSARGPARIDCSEPPEPSHRATPAAAAMQIL